MKKNIIFIITGNIIHGGNSRYVKIFNYLDKRQNKNFDYYLVINSKLYNLFKFKKILYSNKNIFILRNGSEIFNINSLFYKILNNSYISRSIYFIQIMIITARLKNKIFHLGPGGVIISDFIKIFTNNPVICSAFHSGENALKTIRSYYKKADIIETHTPSLYNKILKSGFNNVYLSNGTFFDYTGKDYKLEPENYYKNVIFSGRLELSKNIDLFLDLAVEYKRKHPKSHVKFIIMGEGSLKNKVIKYAEQYNNIKYLGFVSEPFRFLKKGILFFCIQKDKISQSLTEAMLAGNIILMSKEGDYKKFKNPGVFFIAKKSNINDLCNKIFFIMNLDKQNIKVMRLENRKKIERIVNPQNYIEFFERIYTKIN